jgi:hypothetical protein
LEARDATTISESALGLKDVLQRIPVVSMACRLVIRLFKDMEIRLLFFSYRA